MSDGFEGYDAYKLQAADDAGFYRFGQRRKRAAPRGPFPCLDCGEPCQGFHCGRCARRRSEAL